MCRPEVAPRDERVFLTEGIYNINLDVRKCNEQPDSNLKDIVVTNDIAFNDNSRIFILTGPNQGGKTTLIQAVALNQVLFHAGIFVPEAKRG